MSTSSISTFPTPGPPQGLLRILFSAHADPLAYLLGIRERYGDTVMFRGGKGFLIANPDGIKHVLQDNHLNYVKGELYRKAVRPLRGDGLVGADGAAWRLQRRLAQPAFLRKQHDVFAATIGEEAQGLCRGLLEAAAAGRPVDLYHEIARYSLHMILRLIFSVDLGSRINELAAAFLVAELESQILDVFFPIQLPTWIPTPSHVRFRKSRRVMDEFVFDIIRRRRENGAGRSDLLAMYMNARSEETGEGMSDQLLRDEMVTLMSAGHATVADSLTWSFYLLATRADVSEKMGVEAAAALGDRLPSAGDLASLPVTTMVYQETLRLYPSIWGFMRVAVADDVICGHRIAAGARIFLSPYVMHRHPALWEDVERFDPERFQPERIARRHRFAWFPFGAGPHQCIGAGLAFVEAQITLAMVSRVLRFELLPGQNIRPLPRVTLKPNGPIWVRARARLGTQ